MEINTNTPKRSGTATTEQKNLMLEFIKKHPKLSSGKFSSEFTQKQSKTLWEELTNILNSCGVRKDWKAWRKTWQDIRSRTKMKQSRYINERRGTGGGPEEKDPITTYESEVLDIIKIVSVEGHKNVTESATLFEDIGLAESSGDNTNVELTVPTDKPVQKHTDMLSGQTKENAKQKFPRKQRKKLFHTLEASKNYRLSLEKKNNIKNGYYKNKIALLERIAVAKENSVLAKQKIATNIEELTCTVQSFMNMLN